MAVRRKYRSSQPPRYRDGGAVPLAADIVPEPPMKIEEAPPPAPSQAIPPAEPDADNAVMAAVRATLAAEGLHREAERMRREQQEALRQAPPPPVSVNEFVDQIPDLSDHKRSFLKAHPEMLDPTRSRMVGMHYAEALRSGIADDSDEMDSYLLAAVRHDIEQHVAKIAQWPAREPAEARVPQAAFESTEPSAPAAPARRTMPITAPVSRDVPMPSSGQRPPSGITLSPQEREMAVLSYRDLPPAEAERLYAMAKLRLIRERQAGRYPEHGQ